MTGGTMCSGRPTYPDRQAAKRAVLYGRNGGRTVVPFRCPDCNQWHVSAKRQKPKTPKTPETK